GAPLFCAPVADLLDVRLGHDPAGAGGGRAVERHEVRPRLFQVEARARRVPDLDLAHAPLGRLRAPPPVPPARDRQKEKFRAAAVTGSPLWNFAPLRMTNSYVSPSFDCVNDSARHGV